MEYFPSAKRIVESEGLYDYGEHWLTNIIDVVNAFHARGYVHGDLPILLLTVTNYSLSTLIGVERMRRQYSRENDLIPFYGRADGTYGSRKNMIRGP